MTSPRPSASVILVAGFIASAAATVSPATAISGADDRATPLAYAVVSRVEHDPEAFTQGLVLDGSGRLFESTGLTGRSSLRELSVGDGTVLRRRELADGDFGEGLAAVDDRLIQLTWTDGVATVWDSDSFEPVERFEYEGEGWGLCYDGTRLVMSDGSDRLTFRDPSTFEVLGEVAVTLDGAPLEQLNELECVDGAVWSNVWHTDRIVRIDPSSGVVTGVLDLAGIIDPDPADRRPEAVLNGIAYDSGTETFLVTGKLWPQLIGIRVMEAGDAS